jgi:exonuclease SbcC
MIPQRIKLNGFLCYKDEQQIDFDNNSTLWLLSGLNGSGKSSIFDAVTFALFGEHRGGKQQNQELINKDRDAASVEFEFRFDSHVYRIKRTLKRDTKGGARGTQQLFRLESGENGKGKWTPVEDTGSATGFKDWIGRHIGLDYGTFTSSVLLLQGKAEKLLDSTSSGRHEVLAKIVKLERYKRLHEKADAKRKELKTKLEEKHDQLEALPQVKPEQMAQAEEAIQLAEQSRQQASAEVDRLRELEHQAKTWRELQARLATARQRLEQAQRLLAEAADIERHIERLRELREVLMPLREIIKQRGTIREAELISKELLQQKEKVTEQRAHCDSTLNQERDKRTTLQKRIEEQEKQRQELEPRLLGVIAQMEKLAEYDRQSAELAAIREELAPLASDPAEGVSRARGTCERLAALVQLVPQLVRFQEYRDGLRQAWEREQAAKHRQVQLEAHGKQLNGELKRLGQLVAEADEATRQAKDQETEAHTLLKQAQDSLCEITELDGAKRCRHCGQELTPGHLQEETRRRSEDVRKAEERFKNTAAIHQAARREERRLHEEESNAQKNYQQAREDYRDALNQANQAQADVVRLQGELARTYEGLPDEQQRRIGPAPFADWLTTEYPLSSDLEQLRSEAASHPAARQQLHRAEETFKHWSKLKTQEADKLATLDRLQSGLPADHEAVRRMHTDLSVRLETLDKDLKVKRNQRKDADAEIERWTREREHWQGQLNYIDVELKKKELDGQKAREMIALNLKSLPASWQKDAQTAGAAEYNQLDKERADLEAAGTDQRGKELQEARYKLNSFREDKEALESQREAFAAEARRDPADIKVELERAKETEKQRETEQTDARQQLAQLERDRKQREQIGEEHRQLEGEWTLYKTLAELLGKDRLQLHLVRQAEKQVVEHANAVLDRLSGGQLYLRLKGEVEGEGGSDRALDLEAYNRVTGERPINVAFLSGSQKFRVAVSLALGIGQYASRQHRPIESVIIDEGFGCLDSQGRQVMIQELQNLRSQMRCILLVSHQEDFAEAFSDGYHFALESGATRVSRFQR